MARWWPFRRVEQRAAMTLDQLLADQGTPTAAGEPVTTDRALRLSTVWACVRLLADSVSTLPLEIFRRGEANPIAPPAWLAHPSADYDLVDWLHGVMTSLLLRGNAYGLITARQGAGMLPAQAELLHPDHVGVTVNGNGRVTYRLLGAEQDPADIWHVRGFVLPMAPNAPPVGLSPIEYMRECVGLGIASERYAAKFFGDSAIPSGYLHSDQRIGDDAAKHLKAEWEKAHKGKRGTAVLGGVKYQNLSIAPEEAQFVQTQKLNVSAIARIFGINPVLVGGETAGHEDYSSPEQRGVDFLTYSLRPWLSRVERAVGRLLPRNQYARLDAKGFLRATVKERYEAHAVAIASGFLTIDEVRAMEGRPPLPGGAVA